VFNAFPRAPHNHTVVPVRVEILEILSTGDPGSGFFALQVDAFQDRSNAETPARALGPILRAHFHLAICFAGRFVLSFYRVRVGKVPREDAARQFGEQPRNHEGFTSFVVLLDEAGWQEESVSADCLFFKIADKKIPSKLVYEDADICLRRLSVRKRNRHQQRKWHRPVRLSHAPANYEQLDRQPRESLSRLSSE
jgi:hypothetical protein